MDLKTLLAMTSDTGFEDDTLMAVLDSFLTTGNVNVRRLSLPTDRKVDNLTEVSGNNQILRLKKEAMIVKALIDKLDDVSEEKLEEFGITPSLLIKLKSLSEEELFLIIRSDKNRINDPQLISAVNRLHVQCLISDGSPGKRESIFDVMPQKTKFKKKLANPVSYTKRIYMNLPMDEVGMEILTLFKLKCIERGIPSKMKGMGSGGYDEGDLDTTIIYSNDYYLMDHIEILEEMREERPDLFEKTGTPVISGARVTSPDGKCYYTVSSGILDDNTSNSYYDHLYKVSFAILCARHSGINIDNKLVDSIYAMNTQELNKYIRDNSASLLNKIENGEISKEEVVKEYKEIIKPVSSYLRFEDYNHQNVPLYQDDIFMEYVEREDLMSKKGEKIEYIVLFHTEKLVESMFKEYEESELSDKEKCEIYAKKVKALKSKFKVYSKLYPNFQKTARYKQISEYLDSLPDFELYKDDPTKGNSINMILEKRYYKEIAPKLDRYIKSKTKSAISTPKKR